MAIISKKSKVKSLVADNSLLILGSGGVSIAGDWLKILRLVGFVSAPAVMLLSQYYPAGRLATIFQPSEPIATGSGPIGCDLRGPALQRKL